MGLHKGQTPSNFLEMRKKGWLSSKGRPAWNRGLKTPLVTRIKQSKAKEGYTPATAWKKNHLPWNKGLTKEIDKRLDFIRPTSFKKGEQALEKHNQWKGGVSILPYSTDWTETLRISIRERDKYTCQVCGKKQGDITFLIHHIDYNKLNSNPNNLVTLCRNCHSKTNHNREYWNNYFNKTK